MSRSQKKCSHIGRALACSGKVKLDTEADAKRCLKQMRSFSDWNGKARVAIGCYQCKFCTKWHVGTEDREKDRFKRLKQKRVKAKLPSVAAETNDEI